MKFLVSSSTLLALFFLGAATLPVVRAQAPTTGGKVVAGDKEAAVTIWILTYERKDESKMKDPAYLPEKLKPAQEKLKDKGAKKLQFNFKYQQLYVWLEGPKTATLAEIRTAFPGLELKPIASAQFGDQP